MVKQKRVEYTEEEYIQETLEHIELVRHFIHQFIKDLQVRANCHDLSKLEDPEKSIFVKYTPELDRCEYGTEEYQKHLDKVRVALNHHYKTNSHHPEHHIDGVSGMDLLDVVEMYFDWQASAIKYNNSIDDSIRIGVERFNLSQDLESIFKNTAERFNDRI